MSFLIYIECELTCLFLLHSFWLRGVAVVPPRREQCTQLCGFRERKINIWYDIHCWINNFLFDKQAPKICIYRVQTFVITLHHRRPAELCKKQLRRAATLPSHFGPALLHMTLTFTHSCDTQRERRHERCVSNRVTIKFCLKQDRASEARCRWTSIPACFILGCALPLH